AAQRLAVPQSVTGPVSDTGDRVDVWPKAVAHAPAVAERVVDGDLEAWIGQHVRPAAGEPDPTVVADDRRLRDGTLSRRTPAGLPHVGLSIIDVGHRRAPVDD